MEELKVILKDGTDISSKCKMNGTDLLVQYDSTIDNPNEYFKGLSINDVVYEEVIVIKVFLEKDGEYFAIVYH